MSEEIGFCPGVRRAIAMAKDVARQRGGIETLGPLVHNQPVLQKLARLGVRVVNCPDDITGGAVVISAHGVSPEQQAEIQQRHIDIIDTTCPIVHQAQLAARRLARAGFFIIIYGDANHPEVKGILGWANGKGIATLNKNAISHLEPPPPQLGILAQTTQIPDRFTEFVRQITEASLSRETKLRTVDTICRHIKKRQAATVKLATRSNLMLVIGSHHSANTARLLQLCSHITKTHLIETASQIESHWLAGKDHIGVTAGASTDAETIREVMMKLSAVS
ncbi:MAG: 4-hydroxy-3-methylbut-2-enyl diphosphate reductase [Dehalococcoidales bacterium]|nr:4-hydroxy-3-methylbut-2-enyl diphosphate reductase [Dehalococcoidales bacterium]